MKVTAEKNEQVANMIFASIIHFIGIDQKKNGRTRERFHLVLEWFTAFDYNKLQRFIDDKVTLKHFFKEAKLHP